MKGDSRKDAGEVAEEAEWSTQCKDSASAALRVANNLIEEAEKALKEGKRVDAETHYRSSLVNIREALLWEPEEAHSNYLHNIGHRIHDTFGCQLEFKEGLYWITCPVMLSHIKGGFSIGGSGRVVCSICGGNTIDCHHSKGQVYRNVVASKNYGICNICEKKECEHEEGQTYDRARAFGIVVDLEFDHVSFVRNPANPLCAIQSYSMSESDLREMLPEEEHDQITYGDSVIPCHHCLVCSGM